MLDVAGTVEVSSDRAGEGEPFAGTLAATRRCWSSRESRCRRSPRPSGPREAAEREALTDGGRDGVPAATPSGRLRRCGLVGALLEDEAALAVEGQGGVALHAGGGSARRPGRPASPSLSRPCRRSPPSSASMSARVASSEVSMRRSRASWLTQADTSVTAGRSWRRARRPRRDRRPRQLGCSAAAPADRGEQLVAEPRPRTWRSSRPRIAAQLVAATSGRPLRRCPTTPRSGRTKRTGWSISAARRSRHAATAWATPRGRAAQVAGLLDAQPRVLGARSGAAAACAAARTRRAPTRAGRCRSRSAQQVGPAARAGGRRRRPRSVSWSSSSGPAQPVGEAVALGQADAERPARPARPSDGRGVARRSRPPAGCRRASSGTVPQASSRTSRSWLAACMTAMPGPSSTSRQRREVDRQRVDEDDLVVPAELHAARPAGSRCARGGTRCRPRSGRVARRRRLDDARRAVRRSRDPVGSRVSRGTRSPRLRPRRRSGGPTRSRPSVPPATLSASMPLARSGTRRPAGCGRRLADDVARRPRPAPRRARSGTVASGIRVAPGTCASSYSSGSRTSITGGALRRAGGRTRRCRSRGRPCDAG